MARASIWPVAGSMTIHVAAPAWNLSTIFFSSSSTIYWITASIVSIRLLPLTGGSESSSLSRTVLCLASLTICFHPGVPLSDSLNASSMPSRPSLSSPTKPRTCEASESLEYLRLFSSTKYTPSSFRFFILSATSGSTLRFIHINALSRLSFARMVSLSMSSSRDSSAAISGFTSGGIALGLQ